MLLRDRLVAGRRVLAPLTQVRILVPQPKNPRVAEMNSATLFLCAIAPDTQVCAGIRVGQRASRL